MDALTGATFIRERIEGALQGLTRRESQVVKMYFGIDSDLPHTLEEIGQRLRITRERVRQIKERAMRKLQQGPRSLELRTMCLEEREALQGFKRVREACFG